MIVNMNMNPILAIVITMTVSTLMGLFYGFIIVKTNIFAMIGTLAASQIISGITYLIRGGLPISGMPDGIKQLAQGYVGPIPIPVVLFVLIVAVAGFFLNYTHVGRYLYIVGSNGEAARLSGINKQLVQIISFGIGTFLAGFAGIIMMSRVNSG